MDCMLAVWAEEDKGLVSQCQNRRRYNFFEFVFKKCLIFLISFKKKMSVREKPIIAGPINGPTINPTKNGINLAIIWYSQNFGLSSQQ